MDPPLVSKRIKWCRLYYCSPLPQCHSSVHDTRGIRTTTDARSNMATERGTQGSFTAQMQQLATGWWAVSRGGDCDPSWRMWNSRRSCPQQEKKQGRETVTEAARTARSDQDEHRPSVRRSAIRKPQQGGLTTLISEMRVRSSESTS